MNQTVGQWISPPVVNLTNRLSQSAVWLSVRRQSLSQLLTDTVSQEVSPPVGNLANRSVAQSLNQSHTTSVSHLAIRSVRQSLSKSLTLSVSQSVHQWVLLPFVSHSAI